MSILPLSHPEPLNPTRAGWLLEPDHGTSEIVTRSRCAWGNIGAILPKCSQTFPYFPGPTGLDVVACSRGLSLLCRMISMKFPPDS